ncbi:hypothetical protein RIF29_42312 [Crotalaria pallida]|uniref:Uncharacterized protein n=1 Tax=Crotalaria pallida TaxID=3830 RepID=A0AAN9E6P4_CROPI
MAQITYSGSRKVLKLSVLFFIFVSVSFTACSEPQLESYSNRGSSSRRILESEKVEQEKPLKKKTTTQSTKNQTKTIKSNISTKNQTKTLKYNNLSTNKNQTKPIKSSSNISNKNQTKIIKSNNLSSSSKNQTKSSSKSLTTHSTGLLKKLNSSSSSTIKIKKLNSTTSKSSTSTNKSLDLVKASNKTTKATATTKDKTTNKVVDKQSKKPPTKKELKGWFIEEDEDDDLVSEFSDLPTKFHHAVIPDFERISTTSKAYISKANDEITKGFKPYVGKKYAPTIATMVSCTFILLPLLLVSLLCNRIKAYFSLQKILIFIQVYLSIYFTILCISSLITGLEPLKFLYSTSHNTYLCLQVLQSLAYVFYLLLLLMYLVLVFSTECGLGSKFLGLAQTFVGFAVGLHYYVTVFHRLVLRQPPKINWKIHGVYATCFLLISLLARADTRKKAYVEDDGEEGKIN